MLVARSCVTLCNIMDYSPRQAPLSRDFPGKNIAVGSHPLLQGNSIHSILRSAVLRQAHNRCRQPARLFCKDPNTKGRLHPYRIAFLFVKITASRNFVVLLYHTSGCFSIFFLKCFAETSGLPQGRGLLLPPVILYRLPRRYQCTAPQQQNSERFCIRDF